MKASEEEEEKSVNKDEEKSAHKREENNQENDQGTNTKLGVRKMDVGY